MLHFFMTHPERVYSRAQLLDEVWGDHVFVEERTVDVHIRRLRQALEPTDMIPWWRRSAEPGIASGARSHNSRVRRGPDALLCRSCAVRV